MKTTKRVLALLMCMTLAFNYVPANVTAGAKAKYTISKKAGTYDDAVETTVKATKGYKVYYKTSGKFKTKNYIASNASKSFAFTKTSTLSLIIVKSTKKIKAKTLNGSAYKSKIKTFKYTINKVNNPKYTVKDGVLTGGNFKGIKTIVVPEGVKKIGDRVFEYNKDMEAIYLPDSLVEIGESAFNECTALSRITFPVSLEKIGKHAFFECASLTDVYFETDSVTYESSIKEIGEGAFYDCDALSEFYFEGSITNVGDYAFGACDSLNVIVLGSGMTEIPNLMCWNCPKLTRIMIPENIKKIGRRAFEYDKELTSVDTEATFDEIGDEAFAECTSLSEFNINAVKIGKLAFSQDNALSDVELKEGLKSLGEKAFEYSGVSSSTVNIPASLESIGEGALDFNSVTEYTVSEGNPNYSAVDGVLFDKSKKTLIKYPTASEATSYTVPEGVETIGKFAFMNAISLTDVKLSKTTTKLEEGAFLSCESLKNVNLDEGLTDIGVAAFSSTGVEKVVIPDSVTSLGKGAWGSCSKLAQATIGNGIKEIPECLFACDSALSELKLNDKIDKFNATALFGSGLPFENVDMGGNTNFAVKDGVLFSADGKTLIAYPSIGNPFEEDTADYGEYGDYGEYTNVDPMVDSSNASDNASSDSRAASEDAVPTEPDAIGPYDVAEYEKEYTIPYGVETIGAYAFAGTSACVNKLFVPPTVKNFEKSSFGYLSELSQYPFSALGNITIPDATIIASADSAAEKYADDNNFAFFTEDCSANATEISMKMKEKKSFTISGAVKGHTLYFSNDPEIAKIDRATGAITPVAKGSTMLVAATGGKYFSCKLNITDGTEPKKTKDNYTELTDDKGLSKWINTYMDYNNTKAFIKKHCPAIREYSGNDYSHIVAAFYDPSDYYFKSIMGSLGEDYRQYVKLAENLSHELHQAKTNTNLRMFRGTSYIGDITGGGSKVSDMVNSIGKTYVSTAVSSTSLIHGVATGFSGGGVVLEIEGDKDNIPGMYIASFSQYPNEAELLLANKTTYKVLDAGVKAYINEEGYTSYEKYIKLKIVK